MDSIRIVDQDGQERDWTWLVATFGDVNLRRAEGVGNHRGIYRLDSLEALEGPAAQIVLLVDGDGNPLEGINIVRYWPQAPELSNLPLPASTWFKQGVFGPTNSDGKLGFGMGLSDRYLPPEGGPGAIWVADAAGPSDLITGLGMVDNTDHLHLNLVFRLDASAAEPDKPSRKRRLMELPKWAILSSSEPPVVEPAPPPTDRSQAVLDSAPVLNDSDAQPPPVTLPVQDPWDVILDKLDLIAELLEKRLQG